MRIVASTFVLVTLASCGDAVRSTPASDVLGAEPSSPPDDATKKTSHDGDAGSVAADGGASSKPDAGSSQGSVWRPAPGTTWQWQLTGTIDTTVNASVFDVDLYEAPQATIDALHGLGRKVICYYDTAYEPGRPDSARLAPYRGNPVDGWPGQYWLDVREPTVLAVMRDRQTLAQQKRCDGVEADDVDARANKPGFAITGAQQQAFIRALAVDAHAKGMSFGLKNDLDEIPQLLADVDFAVNEECVKYDECDALVPFVAAGKAVFHAEYGSASLASTVCPATKSLGLSTLIKKLDLDAWRVACP